jgi:type IV fimbrial biogenesis protein FimT
VLIERPSLGDFSGFTLIELLITISLIAILALLGMPSMSAALNNAKVRSVAESLQNGLRIAQNEAIRRSHQTAFVLTNAKPEENATATANGRNWYAQVLLLYPGEAVDDAYVQGGSFGNVASGVTITSQSTVICFNSIGRVVANTSTGLGVDCSVPGGVPPMARYDVTKVGADRTLRLEVTPSGKIRMCDTARTVSTVQPDGCY